MLSIALPTGSLQWNRHEDHARLDGLSPGLADAICAAIREAIRPAMRIAVEAAAALNGASDDSVTLALHRLEAAGVKLPHGSPSRLARRRSVGTRNHKTPHNRGVETGSASAGSADGVEFVCAPRSQQQQEVPLVMTARALDQVPESRADVEVRLRSVADNLKFLLRPETITLDNVRKELAPLLRQVQRPLFVHNKDLLAFVHVFYPLLPIVPVELQPAVTELYHGFLDAYKGTIAV